MLTRQAIGATFLDQDGKSINGDDVMGFGGNRNIAAIRTSIAAKVNMNIDGIVSH